MSNKELPLYPKGQVYLGSGILRQATLARCSLKNGATLRHALAQSPSGISFGNKECDFTLEFEIPAEGPEWDILSDVSEERMRSIRFKHAGGMFQIVGALNQADFEFNSTDPVKTTATGVGKVIVSK